MSNPNTIARGNMTYHWIMATTLSPASVAPNTTAEQTFSLTGAALGDCIVVNKPSVQGGLGIVGMRVSAAGIIGIAFSNETTATITPTSAEVYTIMVCRPENKIASGASPFSQVP